MRKLGFSFLIRAYLFSIVGLFAIGFTIPIVAQSNASTDNSVIVQPGAPGQPSRVLPANTSASLPEISPKDIEFMQGMIMHHAQAVEMTALIESRTKNPDVRRLGKRISHTQAEEINFMKRWLKARNQDTEMPMAKPSKMPNMKGMKDMKEHDHSKMEMKMPGMLSPEQMKRLANAKDSEFDKLFLSGMIQHHDGALVMVKDLFETTGAGQDAEIFGFATDVDSGQRAEIRIMQEMLKKIS